MQSSPAAMAFARAARLPADGDNVAVATRRLEARTAIARGEAVFELTHTVLEGHRFVLEPIARGEALLSWGLPFGVALRDIDPGEYVCNEKILRVLAEREVDFALPAAANFRDHLEAHEGGFCVGSQVVGVDAPGSFRGYRRGGGRGVGTRNFVAVLGLTSRSTAFVHKLAERFDDCRRRYPNVDGVVALAHTEGGGRRRPNNLEFVLRTLAGFVVHPNVGAVLVVDAGAGAYGGEELTGFMRANGYPIDAVVHRFVELSTDFERELAACQRVVADWLPRVNALERTSEPLSALKLALQCGGSDAFSGISGNALAGWVAKELLRHGGSANLAETDELIGAEPYVLANVRDADTAGAFLRKIEIFKQRASNHGASAEGNPSGGNNYRGLYNIALKSIGAARKKDPEVRLDYVIDYGAPMSAPGYYFMDSPGNDLESIAGQVASGANLIVFITGNGSITNFPFVPTLKFVTTSGRFDLMPNEMDVNAGRYNDGTPMEALGRETFDLAVRVASGERSKGEAAGHAQVQIWRDWPQANGERVAALMSAPAPSGRPLAVVPGPPASLSFTAFFGERGPSCDHIGLIMPTSLCSGQVARLIAAQLNRAPHPAVSRFVALVHTEGCGSANTEQFYLRTLLGHLRHRFTRRALLLEHGCEKTHNDAVRHYLEKHGIDPAELGWASVQLDGGIDKVSAKVASWFRRALGGAGLPPTGPADAGALRIGLTGSGVVTEAAAGALARVAGGVVRGGGIVVVPANASCAESDAFRRELLRDPDTWCETIEYGRFVEQPGLYVMAAPSEDPAETLTGLGATGVEVMLTHVERVPLQAHPMIPLLQVGTRGAPAARGHAADLDGLLDPAAGAEAAERSLLELIAAAASRSYVPHLYGAGVTSFQLTRGPLGLSL